MGRGTSLIKQNKNMNSNKKYYDSSEYCTETSSDEEEQLTEVKKSNGLKIHIRSWKKAHISLISFNL